MTYFNGQLGEEEGTKEGLGVGIEGLHVAEEAGRLPVLETSQGQELHVFGSLSPAEGINEGSLQCFILVDERGKDDGFHLPCCHIVQHRNHMVELAS